jgi:hypothetical protein
VDLFHEAASFIPVMNSLGEHPGKTGDSELRPLTLPEIW